MPKAAKAAKCSNIKDPKARKACLAKAKAVKKPGNGSAEGVGPGLIKRGMKKMLENIPK